MIQPGQHHSGKPVTSPLARRSSDEDDVRADQHCVVHHRLFWQMAVAGGEERVEAGPRSTGCPLRHRAALRMPTFEDMDAMLEELKDGAAQQQCRQEPPVSSPESVGHPQAMRSASWVLSPQGDLSCNVLVILLRTMDEDTIIQALGRQASQTGLRDVRLSTFAYLMKHTMLRVRSPPGGSRHGGLVPWLQIAVNEYRMEQQRNEGVADCLSHSTVTPLGTPSVRFPTSAGADDNPGRRRQDPFCARGGSGDAVPSEAAVGRRAKVTLTSDTLPVIPEEDIRRLFLFVDWTSHGHVGVATLLDRLRLLYRPPYILRAVCCKRMLYPRHSNSANTGTVLVPCSEGRHPSLTTQQSIPNESIAAVPIASDQLIISLDEIDLMLDGVLHAVVHDTTATLQTVEATRDDANGTGTARLRSYKLWKSDDLRHGNQHCPALQCRVESLVCPQTSYLKRQQKCYRDGLAGQYALLLQVTREVHGEMMRIHDGGFRVPVLAFRQTCSSYPTLMQVVSRIQWDGRMHPEEASVENGFLGTLWRPPKNPPGGCSSPVYAAQPQNSGNHAIPPSPHPAPHAGEKFGRNSHPDKSRVTLASKGTTNAPLTPRQRRAARRQRAKAAAIRETENKSIMAYIAALSSAQCRPPEGSSDDSTMAEDEAGGVRDLPTHLLGAAGCGRPAKVDPSIPDFIADQYINYSRVAAPRNASDREGGHQ